MNVAARREDVLNKHAAWWDLDPLYGDDDEVSMPDRILDAARRCYLQYGAAKMGMHDVATEAQVSRGSVYKYFPNRRVLLAAVSETALESFCTTLNQLMASRDSLSDQISEGVYLMMQGRRRRPKAPGNDAMSLLGLTIASRPLLERLIAVLRPYVEVAKARNEVRARLDTERASEWIARTLIALNTTPGVTFDYDSVEEADAFVREFLIPGLR